MGTMRGRLARAVTVVALAFGAACVAGCGSDAATSESGRTLRVPADHATIQAAVDAAHRGDLILIAPGEYRERVLVATAGLTIRGEQRNEVILDGGHELFNGVEVTASGVAVENLTVRNYVYNAVLIDGAGDGYGDPGEFAPAVDGYRVSYVTTSNNGLYGIYAFGARNGEISHSYASGHPDSGFYIGQCKPCNVVLDDIVAEHNAIGYYGTNASGGVYVVNSTFRGNRLGIAPNSQDAELLAPQAETVVAGNLVDGRDAAAAPAIPQGLFGGGIAVGGGTGNTVVRNRVFGSAAYGIGLVALGKYQPEGNRVEANVLDDNAIDLLYAPSVGTSAAGNCFTGNTFTVTVPDAIEQLLPCSGTAAAALPLEQPVLPVAPPTVDYRTIALPGPQPDMPDATTAAPRPAGPPTVPDVDAIQVPAAVT